MPGPGRRTRLATAAIAVVLAARAPAASAQGETRGLVSAVARVRLVAVMLPRLTPAARALPAGRILSNSAGTGTVLITLSTNTSYRVVARRTDPGGTPRARIWLEGGDGQLHELDTEPLVVRTGRTGDGTILVPYRLGGARERAPAGFPPLRIDVVVQPAL